MEKVSKGLDLDMDVSEIPDGTYRDAPNIIPSSNVAYVVTDDKGVQHSHNIAFNKDREMEMCVGPKICECSALNVRRNKKCWQCGKKLANLKSKS